MHMPIVTCSFTHTHPHSCIDTQFHTDICSIHTPVLACSFMHVHAASTRMSGYVLTHMHTPSQCARSVHTCTHIPTPSHILKQHPHVRSHTCMYFCMYMQHLSSSNHIVSCMHTHHSHRYTCSFAHAHIVYIDVCSHAMHSLCPESPQNLGQA